MNQKIFALIWFSVGITLIAVLVIGMNYDKINGKEVEAVADGTEKEARAYWVDEVQRLSCLELKQIIDEENWVSRGDFFPEKKPIADNVKKNFARAEYMDFDKYFPSERGRECVDQLGYPRDSVGYCDKISRLGCMEYTFERTDQRGNLLEEQYWGLKKIYFPSDWFYTDPFTMEIEKDPNEFLKKYRPDLADYHGVLLK